MGVSSVFCSVKVYFFDRQSAGRGPFLAFGVRLVRALITTIFVATLAGFPACHFWPSLLARGAAVACRRNQHSQGVVLPNTRCLTSIPI